MTKILAPAEASTPEVTVKFTANSPPIHREIPRLLPFLLWGHLWSALTAGLNEMTIFEMLKSRRQRGRLTAVRLLKKMVGELKLRPARGGP